MDRRDRKEKERSKPILEVKLKDVTELTKIFPKGLGDFRDVKTQVLMVKATRSSIKGLSVQLWADEEGPLNLGWMKPHPEIKAPQIIFSDKGETYVPGQITLSYVEKDFDLAEDEEVPLYLWTARRKAPGVEETVSLNTIGDAIVGFSVPQSNTSMEIRFIGDNYIDKERRPFTLILDSWDSLRMIEGISESLSP